MKVCRVATTDGSSVYPRLRDHWPDLKKLRWKAAVLEADTGIKMTVDNDPNSIGYSIQVQIPGGVAGTGGFSFDSLWTYINGMMMGAEAAQRPRRSA